MAAPRRKGMNLGAVKHTAHHTEDPQPAAAVEVVQDASTGRALSPRTTTTRVGITITPEDLDEVRRAHLSDLDTLKAPPPSMARWIVRAVQAHLDRSPADRRAMATAHPGTGSESRKIPYNAPVPLTMRADLEDAVQIERAHGRVITKSGLVREALAIEVAAARRRAGGDLPVVVGKLPHAR